MEGAATIACALVAIFIIPDFPATWKRLSAREKSIATDRLLEQNVVTMTEDSVAISSVQALRASWTNWRTWLLTVGYMVSSAAGSAVRTVWLTPCSALAQLPQCPISIRLWCMALGTQLSRPNTVSFWPPCSP